MTQFFRAARRPNAEGFSLNYGTSGAKYLDLIFFCRVEKPSVFTTLLVLTRLRHYARALHITNCLCQFLLYLNVGAQSFCVRCLISHPVFSVFPGVHDYRSAKSLDTAFPRASTFVQNIFSTSCGMHATKFEQHLLNHLRAIAMHSRSCIRSEPFMLPLSSHCTHSVAPALVILTLLQ